MKYFLFLFAAVVSSAQPSVPTGVLSTYSLQPKSVFTATFGSTLIQLAMYNAETCNYTPVKWEGSEGMIRQLAHESAALSLVDMSLAAPTAGAAQAKTRTAKIVKFAKWIIIIGGSITAGQSFDIPDWAVKLIVGSIVSVQTVDTELTAQQSTANIQAANAVGNMLNPVNTISIPPGGCLSKLFLAEYKRGFKPSSAHLPSSAVPIPVVIPTVQPQPALPPGFAPTALSAMEQNRVNMWNDELRWREKEMMRQELPDKILVEKIWLTTVVVASK